MCNFYLIFTTTTEIHFFEDGPCGHGRPGDADLDTWDIIQQFHLDHHDSHYETVSQISGSNGLQTAYRLEREANLTMKAHEAFPRGIPFEFSLECTYRQPQPQQESWHLFHLTNSREESQLAVTLNPAKQTLELALPDIHGELQTVEFRHSAVSNLPFFPPLHCFVAHFLFEFKAARS